MSGSDTFPAMKKRMNEEHLIFRSFWGSSQTDSIISASVSCSIRNDCYYSFQILNVHLNMNIKFYVYIRKNLYPSTYVLTAYNVEASKRLSHRLSCHASPSAIVRNNKMKWKQSSCCWGCWCAVALSLLGVWFLRPQILQLASLAGRDQSRVGNSYLWWDLIALHWHCPQSVANVIQSQLNRSS